MATRRKPAQPETQQRRITATISYILMCRVGSYAKYSNTPLSEIMESALSNYLASKRFSVRSGGDDAEQTEAA